MNNIILEQEFPGFQGRDVTMLITAKNPQQPMANPEKQADTHE